MKYIYALAGAVISAFFAAFGSAIVLAIINLYLTGHGIFWPGKEFNWHFISMSLLDFIMLTVTFTVMIWAYLIILKYQNSSANVE